MGLPLDGLIDEEEADEYEDAFKAGDAASDDGTIENMDNKDNVTWSYSQYVQTLDKEDILNNVDEMTFSSLTLNSQGTGKQPDTRLLNRVKDHHDVEKKEKMVKSLRHM